MDIMKCPKCGGDNLFDGGEDEMLQKFVVFAKCHDCGAKFDLVYKSEDEHPWTCPKCGGDCDWDMDEECEPIDDDCLKFEAYGSCPDCGCEVVEVYVFDHAEPLESD